MARKMVFIQDTTGPQRTNLDDIPQEVKEFVEECFTKQSRTPGRTQVAYDTKEELENEFKLMADYCAQRKQGILRIRKSPTRKLAETVMEFRITRAIEENGARNAGNNAKVSSAAK